VSPKPASSKAALADKVRLNRLSHISVATWVGVGLTLAGLVVAVYYGMPMMRLAIWTAKNDFREACKSELDTALPQSSACKAALGQPPQPPPIKKRSVLDVRRLSLGLRLSILATCCASMVLLFRVSKNLIQQSRRYSKQNKTSIMLSTPMHDRSGRGALILCLFDTAQRLQVEIADWGLPAKLKLKLKLIAMIEQIGSCEKTLIPPPTQQTSSRRGIIAATLYTSRAYWMLCWIVHLRVPIAISSVLFICSYLYAERYPHQSSDTSQWSSGWESTRIMLLITASYKLRVTKDRERAILWLSIVLCAILMPCNHFLNKLIDRMGKEGWVLATGIISFCAGAWCSLMFSFFYLIGAICDAEELPQLVKVLTVFFTVLTICS
jgi:hypothetical protein